MGYRPLQKACDRIQVLLLWLHAPFCQTVFKEHGAVELEDFAVVLTCGLYPACHVVQKSQVEPHLSPFVGIAYGPYLLRHVEALVVLVMEGTEHPVFDGLRVAGSVVVQLGDDFVAEFLGIQGLFFHKIAVSHHEGVGDVDQLVVVLADFQVVFVALHEGFAGFGPFFLVVAQTSMGPCGHWTVSND